MSEHQTTLPAGPEEEGTDLLELLLVVAREKRTILRATATAALFGALIALLLPGVYTARAVILPPHEDYSGLNSMALGALAELSSSGGGGFGAALGLTSPSDLY